MRIELSPYTRTQRQEITIILDNLIMKKSQDPFEVIFTKQGENVNIISFTWSRSGVVRAWLGYSEHCLGYASGYGYDKLSTALVQAIKKLYKIDLDGAGAGWRTVAEHAKKQGIGVYLERDLAWEAMRNK